MLRLKWRIADLLNRLRRTCWADLAGWANGTLTEGRTPLDFTAVTECRAAAARCGSCYCGKFIDRNIADAQRAIAPPIGDKRIAPWRIVRR